MADWGESYEAQWIVRSVNPRTWGDENELVGFRSVMITHSCSEAVPLLESAKMTLDLPLGTEFEPGWYRIEMRAIFADGTDTLVALGTFYFENTDGTDDFAVNEVHAKGRSVLSPASVGKLKADEYVRKGEDGAAWCARILQQVTPAPVETDGSFTVDRNYVFEPGTKRLKAVWDILDAADWCMQVDGDGYITIMEKPEVADLNLDRANASLLMPGIDYDEDYTDVPNRYIAVEGNHRVEIVNDDPESPTSYTTRGYYHDEYDDDPIRTNGMTLEEYAAQELESMSTLVKTYSYTREYWPGVYPFSMVKGNLPGVFENEDLRVLTQSYDCSHGIIIEEQVGLEVKLWEE